MAITRSRFLAGGRSCRSSAFAGMPQIFQDLEHKTRCPFGAPASQGQRDSGSFENLLPARSKVSGTADVVLDSTVAPLADADAQGNQFFVLPLECAGAQRAGL